MSCTMIRLYELYKREREVALTDGKWRDIPAVRARVHNAPRNTLTETLTTPQCPRQEITLEPTRKGIGRIG